MWRSPPGTSKDFIVAESTTPPQKGASEAQSSARSKRRPRSLEGDPPVRRPAEPKVPPVPYCLFLPDLRRARVRLISRQFGSCGEGRRSVDRVEAEDQGQAQ